MKFGIFGDHKPYRVIQILQDLGGHNIENWNGTDSSILYYIKPNGEIYGNIKNNLKDYIQFTCEEFESEYPNLIGETVLDKDGNEGQVIRMKWVNDRVRYQVAYDCKNYDTSWWDIDKISIKANNQAKYKFYVRHEDKVEIVFNHNTHEMVNENDTWCVVEKKPQYPVTWEECAKVLEVPDCFGMLGYKLKLLSNFQKLLVCRDTYWKICSYKKDHHKETYAIVNYYGEIVKTSYCGTNAILEFPTKEIRDLFLKNFKDLIETCKELL